MRRFCFIWVFCTLWLVETSYAQNEDQKDEEQIKTLLSRKSKIRGFGAMDLKVGKWNDEINLIVGGHGGIILDNRFTLGLGGYGITTRSRFNGLTSQENVYLGGGYGGLLLGYSILAREVVHLNFPILFGGGGIDILEDQDGIFSNGVGRITESSGFFIVEPGVEVEINIARFFKLAIGGTYRIIEGANLNDIDTDKLGGLSTHISFKVGKF